MWENYLPIDDMKQPLGTDYQTLCKILRTQNQLANGELTTVTGFHHGCINIAMAYRQPLRAQVATEWQNVELLSTYYAQLNASMFSGYTNASIFQHVKLKSSYKQNSKTAKDQLDNSKTYVCYYMADWDGGQAIGSSLIGAYWSDPNRGKIPLAWGFNAYCEKLAPQALEYMYETKSVNDYFVLSDNGTGYISLSSLMKSNRPSGLNGSVASWQETAKKQFTRWDMDIGGFLLICLTMRM